MKNRCRCRCLPWFLVLTALLVPGCGGTSQSIDARPPQPLRAGVTWTGEWSTNFGPVVLQQKEDGVSGAYKYQRKGQDIVGILAGKVDGHRLTVRWQDQQGGAGSGHARFLLADDGGSFVGTWGGGDSDESGGEWSGTRVR